MLKRSFSDSAGGERTGDRQSHRAGGGILNWYHGLEWTHEWRLSCKYLRMFTSTDEEGLSRLSPDELHCERFVITDWAFRIVVMDIDFERHPDLKYVSNGQFRISEG
jgi:hypothetical protein